MAKFSMLAHFLGLTACALTATVCSAVETVVFVHGFGGSGPDEGGTYFNDLPKIFEDKGFNVIVTNVGAISSNWDRACELYTELKGGTVDYGVAHSAKYGHERYGKTLPGKFPEWGPDNRVHFIGHSMGGNTIRRLEHLLNLGDQAEIDAGSTSSLFTKSGNWVKSVTTIQAPHEGTTIFNSIVPEAAFDLLQQIALKGFKIGASLNLAPSQSLDLEQFGIKNEGMSPQEYWNLIFRSDGILDPSGDFEDISVYDLKAVGAQKLQQLGPQTYPDTHYLGITTDYTNRIWPLNIHLAKLLISPVLSISANGMGGLGNPREWRPNDGVVPTISHKCPQSQYPGATCQKWRAGQQWEAGKWFWDGIESLDHFATLDSGNSDTVSLYNKIADRIHSLSDTRRALRADSPEV